MPGKRSPKMSKSNEKTPKPPAASSNANIAETTSSLSLSSITTSSPQFATPNTSMLPLRTISSDKISREPKSSSTSKSSECSTSAITTQSEISYDTSLTETLSNTTLKAQSELCCGIENQQRLEKPQIRFEIGSEMNKSTLEPNSVGSRDNASQPQIAASDLSSDVNEQFNKKTTYTRKHPQSKSDDAQCYERKLSFVSATSGESGDEDEHSKRPLHYTVDYHEMSRRFSQRTLAEIYDDEFFSYADRRSDLPNKSDLKEGIFCCMITGLVIASLVMTSYFIILLIDPITDSMDILHHLFYNLTKLIIGNQQRYHHHHHN